MNELAKWPAHLIELQDKTIEVAASVADDVGGRLCEENDHESAGVARDIAEEIRALKHKQSSAKTGPGSLCTAACSTLGECEACAVPSGNSTQGGNADDDA